MDGLHYRLLTKYKSEYNKMDKRRKNYRRYHDGGRYIAVFALGGSPA